MFVYVLLFILYQMSKRAHDNTTPHCQQSSTIQLKTRWVTFHQSQRSLAPLIRDSVAILMKKINNNYISHHIRLIDNNISLIIVNDNQLGTNTNTYKHLNSLCTNQ